jgi:hypothetical protein
MNCSGGAITMMMHRGHTAERKSMKGQFDGDLYFATNVAHLGSNHLRCVCRHCCILLVAERARKGSISARGMDYNMSAPEFMKFYAGFEKQGRSE